MERTCFSGHSTLIGEQSGMRKSSRYRTAREVLQNFSSLRVTAGHVDTFFSIEPLLGISHDKRHVG